MLRANRRRQSVRAHVSLLRRRGDYNGASKCYMWIDMRDELKVICIMIVDQRL